MNTLKINRDDYERMYKNHENFLEYPALWVIGFYNSYLKEKLPKGNVLDYGYGSGNNSVYLMKKGYEVYGTEVAESSLELLKENMNTYFSTTNGTCNHITIKPNTTKLPYPAQFFDFILSNQVLYYLPSKEHIQKLCKEFRRILKPGGVVMFTMMGLKNYMISKYGKEVKPNLYKVEINKGRLKGFKNYVYIPNGQEEILDLFKEFKCLKLGYFDNDIMDGSNFHYIFIGK